MLSRIRREWPKQAVRFPRVGHELTHVEVFGVVKGEVFEVCRNETHPSQATNEASHGLSVAVDEGPARRPKPCRRRTGTSRFS